MPLAQLNIARILAPLDSPVMKDFVDNIDRINALAEGSPGFIWRFKEDNNNATSARILDDDFLIVNFSVWNDLPALFDFVYRTDHVEIFKRRGEWFEKMTDAYAALWYVPDGHFPSLRECEEKIISLRQNGDTEEVFSMKEAARRVRSAVK